VDLFSIQVGGGRLALKDNKPENRSTTTTTSIGTTTNGTTTNGNMFFLFANCNFIPDHYDAVSTGFNLTITSSD